MHPTRRLRNALDTTATPAGRPSRGELSSGFASPVVMAQVVHRLEEVTSELDLGRWRCPASTTDDALGILCDD